MKKLIVASFILFGLAGCATVPMADDNQDAAAKKFAVASDKSGLYIFRNESMGAGVTMDVLLDGKPVGQTVAKTYIYKEVEPGKHSITSKSENTDTIEVDAKPGTLVYVWQEVKMGVLYARTKLSVVGDYQGKNGVRESKLIAVK
ncbi:DUF2846 domain-containing protein [Pseudaeromonas paramecii]|uniref:DUF2846 domain-containing protein n=1 Tax=Pseudaeromonas paramecii TaxID=2138166 RepID=A0ABP8PX43_9GAMM